MIMETGYLDLDLQSQTSKILVLLLKIEPFGIFPSNLNNCLSSILMLQIGLKTGDLDLNFQGQIGLET